MLSCSLQCVAYITKSPLKRRSVSNEANLHSKPNHRLRCPRIKCVLTDSVRFDQLNVARSDSNNASEEHPQAIPQLDNADNSATNSQEIVKRETRRRKSVNSGKERRTSPKVAATQAKRGPYPSRDLWKRSDNEGDTAIKTGDSSNLNMVRR